MELLKGEEETKKTIGERKRERENDPWLFSLRHFGKPE